jgi:APA family basic amino acid/polyamine antiporter
LSAAAGKPPATERPRILGFWMCTALVVGNIIGIGIFSMPASLAPYGLNALTGWLVNVVGCLFLALSFAGLARAFPRDDGPSAYITRAFGKGVAFFAMWCYWASICIGNAAIAIGLVGYIAVFVPALTHVPGLPAITALSVIWAFVFINLMGAKTAAWVQLVTTVLKLLPQLAVIVLGLWLLLTAPALYTAHVPANPPAWREVSSVSTLALFAMLGIECAMIPASRVTPSAPFPAPRSSARCSPPSSTSPSRWCRCFSSPNRSSPPPMRRSPTCSPVSWAGATVRCWRHSLPSAAWEF